MKKRLVLALWWGLAGGSVLGLATAKNVAIGLLIQPVPWPIVIGLPPALFGIGFVCGSVAGLLSGLSDLLGWIGDAIIGATIGGLFLAACELLCSGTVDESAGVAVFGAMIGGPCGILFGLDWRREAARERRRQGALATHC
jgi:hypothetical protein